jgi:GAF domain-containing protein
MPRVGPSAERPGRAPAGEELLGELGRTGSGAGGLEAALARILAYLGADSGTVHVLVDGRLELRAHAGGIPGHVLAVIASIPVGKGMAGLAVERRAPVTSCDLERDDSGDVRPLARTIGLRGSIVVPMMAGAEAIGALGVANRAERVFHPPEVDWLLAAGRSLARAVRAGTG